MRTSLYVILCIAVRLGALVLAIDVFEVLLTPILPLSMPELQSSRLFAILVGGALLIVAAALRLWPGVLARLAAGRSTKHVFETPLAADALQRIAFSVVGVLLVIESLCGFASDAMRMIATVTTYGQPIEAAGALDSFHRRRPHRAWSARCCVDDGIGRARCVVALATRTRTGRAFG